MDNYRVQEAAARRMMVDHWIKLRKRILQLDPTAEFVEIDDSVEVRCAAEHWDAVCELLKESVVKPTDAIEA